MADAKPDMSKDPKVVDAVGYGFDASIRKGTQAGSAAMEKYMSGLSEEQKMWARDAFNKRVAKQSSVIDNPDRIKKGEQQVKVYRKAAQEGRSVNYKKEFATAKRSSNSAPTPKQSGSASSRPATAKASPTIKSAPKAVGKAAPVPKLKLEAIPGPTQSQKPATKAPAKAPAKASVKSAPKTTGKVTVTGSTKNQYASDMGFRPFAKTSQNGPVAKPKTTSVGSQRPKASPLKSILNLASPKQGQPPQGFRKSGSGPSSMLVPKFDKKK